MKQLNQSTPQKKRPEIEKGRFWITLGLMDWRVSGVEEWWEPDIESEEGEGWRVVVVPLKKRKGGEATEGEEVRRGKTQEDKEGGGENAVGVTRFLAFSATNLRIVKISASPSPNIKTWARSKPLPPYKPLTRRFAAQLPKVSTFNVSNQNPNLYNILDGVSDDALSHVRDTWSVVLFSMANSDLHDSDVFLLGTWFWHPFYCGLSLDQPQLLHFYTKLFSFVFLL